MAIETAVNIPINVDGTSSVKEAGKTFTDLGNAVRQTKQEAEQLAIQYGINDDRTKEAIRKAAEYRNGLEDLNKAIHLNKSGFDQVFTAVQGVAAGFELAGGAMALFGSESEDLEKALIKVQGAMVFAQGLKDLKEFAPALKNIGMLVAGPLINAFRSFGVAARAAIASTGIGLLVVAVGSLVAYWDQIKESLTGVSQAQKDILETQTKSTNLAKQQLDDISAQENILRLQGKTEEEILQLKIQATKTVISGLEAQLLTQKEIKKQQVETAKQNKKLLEGLIMFAYAPIEIILKGIDLALNALGKKSDLVGGFTSGLASLVFDPEEIEKKGNETIEATEKELKALKNSLAGYELGVKKIREDGIKQKEEDKKNDYNQEEADRKKREAAQKAHLEYLLKLEQEYQNSTKAELDDSLKRLQEYYDEKNLALLRQLNDGQITQQQYDQESAKLQKEHLDNTLVVQKDYGVSTVATETAIEQGKLNAAKDATAEKIKLDELKKKSEADLYKASQDLATAIVSLAGEQTKLGKGIALAQVAADTARALSGALANSNSPTPDNVATGGLAGITKYIALAATILTNAKRARDIIKSGNTSYSAASPSLPSATVANATIRSSSLPQSENILATNRKVYVLEGDITRTQRTVKGNQSVSVLGG